MASVIPSLCRLEGVSSAGSCRLCLVEVAGVDRLLPACTTPAQRGMSVTTNFGAPQPSPAAWRWSCCSSSATTSAPSASPTVIANCRRWPRAWASPTSATPTTRRACRWTCRIRASCSTTTAASCAPAACGSATRSKARTSGTSAAAASTRGWWPNSIGRGANRAPAPAAASASRSAPPAPWSRRARRSRR